MGTDETVALTAFVVIALHHGLAVFQDENSQQLKKRVVRKPGSVCPSCPTVLALGAQAHRLRPLLCSRKPPS